MELDQFMRRVGAGNRDLARAIDRHDATISRIRRKVIKPSAADMLAINAWADQVAREMDLAFAERLDWGYLLRK